LLPERFKFLVVESKITTLASVLRRALNLIQAIGICVGNDFVWQDAWKRIGEDDGLQSNKCSRKDKEMVE